MEDRHLRILYRKVRAMVRKKYHFDYDTEQEITQRAILALFKQDRHYYADSYIIKVINSSISDNYREKHKRRLKVAFCEYNEDNVENATELNRNIEINADIDKILAQLSQREAYIVKEYALNGATFAEIAQIFGMTKQNIHLIYTKSMAKLTQLSL